MILFYVIILGLGLVVSGHVNIAGTCDSSLQLSRQTILVIYVIFSGRYTIYEAINVQVLAYSVLLVPRSPSHCINCN